MGCLMDSLSRWNLLYERNMTASVGRAISYHSTTSKLSNLFEKNYSVNQPAQLVFFTGQPLLPFFDSSQS
jgi:hypothetical protein